MKKILLATVFAIAAQSAAADCLKELEVARATVEAKDYAVYEKEFGDYTKAYWVKVDDTTVQWFACDAKGNLHTFQKRIVTKKG